MLDQQLNNVFPLGSITNLNDRINSLGSVSQFASRLDEPAKRVSLYFPQQPPEDNLHIIVEKPVACRCFLRLN